MCGWAFISSRAVSAARSSILAKPAVENGAPRSETNNRTKTNEAVPVGVGALHYKMLRNLFGNFRYQFSRNALPVERKPERYADFIRLTVVASYWWAPVSSFTKSPSNHGSKRSLQNPSAWAQLIEHTAPILPQSLSPIRNHHSSAIVRLGCRNLLLKQSPTSEARCIGVSNRAD